MIIYRGANSIFSHQHTKELQYYIKQDYDENKAASSHSSFAYRLEKTLLQTGIAEILEIINCVITLIIIIFYIISTYTYEVEAEDTTNYDKTNELINNIEIFLCVFLIAHYCLKVYTSQNRIFFIFTFSSIIDCGTIICILLAKQNFMSDDMKFYLRLFRMVRILYFYKIEVILQRRSNETVRYSYKLIINIIAIIFLSTSLILEMENQNTRSSPDFRVSKTSVQGTKGVSIIYRFHDMIYFMLVTLCTIGFGDITPKSNWGRFATIITIVTILGVIPTQYQKLKTILALTSKYSRISYRKYAKNSKHLIILGDCGAEGFDAFLQELYHEDHGNVDYETVIMQSSPNEEIMKLIKQANFTNKIFYLVGNSLIHKDLARCKADSAICIVLLANKQAKNPRLEDFSNILQAFSFKKFASIYAQGAEIRICIQLLRPETKEIYFSSLINKNDLSSQDQVICVEEIKLQLLGKSCLCPGINTIVSSLITSKKPSIEDGQGLPPEMKWMNEYLEGMQREIYVVTLEAELVHNLRFIELVKIIYEVSGLTAIGVDVIMSNLVPFVCLNPYSYVLSPFDHLVYILADKQPDEKQINQLIREHLEKGKRGNLENNAEIVKLERMKNPHWISLSDGLHGSSALSNLNNLKSFNRDAEGGFFAHKELGKNAHLVPLKSNSKSKQKDIFSTNKQNFLMTIHPRTQHEAETFSQEILDHHIIVCGLGPNLKNLIMPLRATSMKNQQFPILIIDKEDHIPSEIWKEIQYYPDLYYMQGSPMKSKDLYRASIRKAKAVIILSKNNFDKEMVDADTIFIYKAIKNETKTALIIADIASIATIGFISSSEENFQKQGYRLSETFAVGEIYISSMLDTLMCQAFYNPYITDILQQLILGSAAFNYTPEVVKKLQDKKITQSTLYLLNISEELLKMGKKDFPKKIEYEELFRFFADHNMVPIGIHRNTSKVNASNSNKLEKRYVYLCPEKSKEVYVDHDKIYVLASEEDYSSEKPTQNSKQKDSTYHYTKNLKLIDNSNELSARLAQKMKELLLFNSTCIKNDFSVKKVVDLTRTCLRTELAQVHDELGEERGEGTGGEGEEEQNVTLLNRNNMPNTQSQWISSKSLEKINETK